MKSLDEIQGVLRDCKHGQLARSCEICSLESDNAKLKAELDQLKWAVKVNTDEGKQYNESLRKDRDRWKAMATDLVKALKAQRQMRDMRRPTKGRIKLARQ